MKLTWDQYRIMVVKKLLATGWINAEDYSRLKHDHTIIIDDTDFPVEVCENGDVYIHECGAYPYYYPKFEKPWSEYDI